MKVIGLTGGIGSSKSTVAGFLAELGAVVIDADETGHEVLETDSSARQQIMAAFGQQVFTPEDRIDRKKLGDIVFKNRDARYQLNRIMHPRIYRMVKARLEQYREQGVDVVVIEAPLLLEAGWVTLVDNVWVTKAAEATILKRLEKTGISRDDVMARIRSQPPYKERVKLANVVINTDCSLDELKVKVGTLWQEL